MWHNDDKNIHELKPLAALLPNRKSKLTHEIRIAFLFYFASLACVRLHWVLDVCWFSLQRSNVSSTRYIVLISHYSLIFTRSQWIFQTDTKRNFHECWKYLDELFSFLLTSMPIYYPVVCDRRTRSIVHYTCAPHFYHRNLKPNIVYVRPASHSSFSNRLSLVAVRCECIVQT